MRKVLLAVAVLAAALVVRPATAGVVVGFNRGFGFHRGFGVPVAPIVVAPAFPAFPYYPGFQPYVPYVPYA